MTDRLRLSLHALELWVTPDHVGHFQMNRPKSANALTEALVNEIPVGLKWLVENGARAILVSGNGRNFCGGIDLSLLASLATEQECRARGTFSVHPQIRWLQESMTAFERARVPVIAAVHGACLGAGIDLITACDVRFAASDAQFCIKEGDFGFAADMGTLQRLPTIVGHGAAMELALSVRTFDGTEAARHGLISRAVPGGRDAVLAEAEEFARLVAAKSPVAMVSTKRTLLFKRDHTVDDGIEQIAALNAAVLPNQDVAEVFLARTEGRKPRFSKL